MPIPLDTIRRDKIIPRILAPTTTVEELLYLLCEQSDAAFEFLAIVRVRGDAYAIITLADLCAGSWPNDESLLSRQLNELPGLLQPDAPLFQDALDSDEAAQRVGMANRQRCVVLDRQGMLVGCLIAGWTGSPISPVLVGGNSGSIDWTQALTLISFIKSPQPAVLNPTAGDVPEPPTPANINTRFDGLAAGQPLTVGAATPLRVSVGAPTINTTSESSRPFKFEFAASETQVTFTVLVDADPETWDVIAARSALIVVAPGETRQDALFLVTPKKPGNDKLMISIERADTGALVQKFWLPVVAAAPNVVSTLAAAPLAASRTEVAMPLAATDIARRTVEITLQPGEQDFVAVVRADLPNGTVRETYRVPVSGAEIQNAALRLRQELEKIVFYRADDGSIPFASKQTLDVDEVIAKRAIVSLADAGEQVWHLLFNAPRAPDGLKQFAADLRSLPQGSSVQIVLESQQCIIPWALLYDKPGPLNADTLDWAGFWGYRYIIDVLPPGRYPTPTITDAPVSLHLLLNDDANLQEFTRVQEQFAQGQLGSTKVGVTWGNDAILAALGAPLQANLLYFYCHGAHESGATPNPNRDVTALASESALQFGGQQRIRLADLRRLPTAPLTSRPLVFLNACEGATQDAFYYDGFMPFFIEEQGARGFIGTEVKAPQLLAHDVALQFMRLFAQGQPVGEILWRLRRQYLDTHHTILAFNYSLYCLGDVRLAPPPLSTP